MNPQPHNHPNSPGEADFSYPIFRNAFILLFLHNLNGAMIHDLGTNVAVPILIVVPCIQGQPKTFNDPRFRTIKYYLPNPYSAGGMKQPIADIDLLARLQKDDTRAFDQVFEHFYPALLYFAVTIINNKQEGEDIVMDTFRKFWQLRNNFETVPNIKAFLYITTRNACFNYLKYAQRQTSNRQKFLDVADPGHEETVERLMIETETLQIIYNAVKELPKKCRQVFELTYFEGMNNHEIAKEMGITISTITSQRSRAIQLLKENLGGIKWSVVYVCLEEMMRN